MKTKECEKISFLVDNNEIEELKKILEKDNSIVTCRDRMGRTLLVYANEDKYLDIAKLLIEHGADTNAKDENNWSALHFASQNQALSIIELLIANGAIVNAQDSNGNTALHNAVYNQEIKKYLLCHGANMSLKNFHDVSPEDMLNY